jgi:ribosomal protein L29
MKKKNDQELSTLLVETRVSLHKLRFEAAGARPKDSSAPRMARKTIARILTEQNARTHAK